MALRRFQCDGILGSYKNRRNHDEIEYLESMYATTADRAKTYACYGTESDFSPLKQKFYTFAGENIFFYKSVSIANKICSSNETLRSCVEIFASSLPDLIKNDTRLPQALKNKSIQETDVYKKLDIINTSIKSNTLFKKHKNQYRIKRLNNDNVFNVIKYYGEIYQIYDNYISSIKHNHFKNIEPDLTKYISGWNKIESEYKKNNSKMEDILNRVNNNGDDYSSTIEMMDSLLSYKIFPALEAAASSFEDPRTKELSLRVFSICTEQVSLSEGLYAKANGVSQQPGKYYSSTMSCPNFGSILD